MHRYRRLAGYAWRQWPRLGLIAALTLVAALTTALQPWPLKVLLDHGLGTMPVPDVLAHALEAAGLPATRYALIAVAGAATVILFAVSSAIDLAIRWAWTAAGQRMVYDLAADVFYRLQRLSEVLHGRRSVGDALARLTGDTWCIYKVADSLLISPLGEATRLVTMAVVAWRLNPTLAFMAVLVAPLLAAVAVASGRIARDASRRAREAEAQTLTFVHETLGAIPVVQAFDTRPRNLRRFETLSAAAIAASRDRELAQSRVTLLSGVVTVAGGALVLLLGGWQVLAGSLSLGGLFVFVSYLQSMQTSAQRLVSSYAELKGIEASVDRVFEILDADEPIHDKPGAIVLPAFTSVQSGRGRVALDHVTVGYEAGRPALVDVSLDVAPGEVIALVGPTGAGKSTLISLLLRFLDPWSGSVRLHRYDLRDVQMASLRSQIALVLQETQLLPLSVAANIAYGRPGATRAEVVAAAVAARADTFIRRLPEGYDTLLGERGATLSGGERQRLAVARALLKDAPILILDEPSAALDAETEAALFDSLEQLIDGRTTFIVSHRLSIVQYADRILVLDAGRVDDVGTHAELMGRNGLYARMHRERLSHAPGASVA